MPYYLNSNRYILGITVESQVHEFREIGKNHYISQETEAIFNAQNKRVFGEDSGRLPLDSLEYKRDMK